MKRPTQHQLSHSLEQASIDEKSFGELHPRVGLLLLLPEEFELPYRPVGLSMAFRFRSFLLGRHFQVRTSGLRGLPSKGGR